MGDMKDQYEDGRYDMNPGLEHDISGFYPDGILQPPPPLLTGYSPQPDLSWLPAGLGPGFRVDRGGIKYPKPTKETHMPEKLTKAQIAHELRVNNELMKQLRTRRQDLQKQAATALPAEPPNYTMFTVSVRFTMRGKRYQFLILRSGRQYFTTGTSPSHNRFDSWEALCEWLEGDTVYDHSDIEILQGAKKIVSFDTGTIVDEDTIGQPPF